MRRPLALAALVTLVATSAACGGGEERSDAPLFARADAGVTSTAVTSPPASTSPAASDTTVAATTAPVTTRTAATAATAVTSTIATTTSAATSTTAALPVPAAVPADDRPPTAGDVIGHIEIPKLNLSADLRDGVTLTTIDKGPAHWPGTAMPGQLGNVVIAGHRVTHSRPFRYIDTLGAGDQVIFTTPAGRFVYEFAGNEIVDDSGIHIIEQTRDYTATLFACHPPGSARQRFVVHLRLVDPAPPPVDA